MPSPSRFKLSTALVLVLAAVLLVPAALLVGLVAASSVKTGSNVTALQIGGGPIEDRKIKRCIPAGTHENLNSPGDDYVYYPLSERDWDATGQRGADSDPMRSVSSDNVEMQVPMARPSWLRHSSPQIGYPHSRTHPRYCRWSMVEFRYDDDPARPRFRLGGARVRA